MSGHSSVYFIRVRARFRVRVRVSSIHCEKHNNVGHPNNTKSVTRLLLLHSAIQSALTVSPRRNATNSAYAFFRLN